MQKKIRFGRNTLSTIKDIRIENIRADVISAPIRVYIGEKYPEFHMMDAVPAKGLYLRNIENSQISDCKLSFKAEDVRKLYHIEDCNDLTVENISEVN